MEEIQFSEAAFLEYWDGQFQSDFDRFFNISIDGGGNKFVYELHPSFSAIDNRHPSRSIPQMPIAAAAAVAVGLETEERYEETVRRFQEKWAGAIDGFSLEKDWYFCGIFTFMILWQKSVDNVVNPECARWPLLEPFPYITDKRMSNEPLTRILDAAAQGPGSRRYHKYYFLALDVVIPILLKNFERKLDEYVDVYKKSHILESFKNNLDTLMREIETVGNTGFLDGIQLK